jgi:hypothetical protein
MQLKNYLLHGRLFKESEVHAVRLCGLFKESEVHAVPGLKSRITLSLITV